MGERRLVGGRLLEPAGKIPFHLSRALDPHRRKYVVDEEGYYHYCGRTDDMLKVSGQWVSPFEVESALLGHEAVLEAAVVAAEDEQGLVKPRAFIVPREGVEPDADLGAELQEFVKDRLAPFKYPRWIEFTRDLPKTATGKIQRFKLRQ